MDRIPSSIIFDIFSRVPARCLARSRCVSKIWCKYIDDRYLTIIHDKRVVEEPTPILYHYHISIKKRTLSLCFHVSEFKQVGTTHLVFEPKKGPFLEFLRKRPPCGSSIRRIEAQGSCNGLICLSQDDGYVITSLAVLHPLRKEYYELPPFPLHFEKHMRRESCGLGFDAFTNTWKMVCVLLKAYTPPDKPDMVMKNLCTMVHVFGTNSWREIPQVSSYPVTGKAVFANGCLHWLVSHIDMKTEDGGREVIWFDVNKEEFGLIKRPKRMCDLWRNYSCYYDQLVDLNGEVGYVCSRTMEVWVLKQKEWVPHCWFEKYIIPDGYIEVLGCWNKDGDMLIKNLADGRYAFFVYNRKSGVLHNTNVAGAGLCPDIFMYPNSLSSIRGINTNSFSVRKTGVKKSCHNIYTTNPSHMS
ncbi:F-box domain containing protein [Tanacetum coccineum]|uniref:F-box domain containing protein n=1 Tax=Tanacetum coccineum TaxID=301880 RepID=A0ABQ5F3F8_9ASTR